MAGLDRVQKRFDELDRMADDVAATSRPDSDEIGETVDSDLLVQWKTSVGSLLHRVFQDGSPTVDAFKNGGKAAMYADDRLAFDELRAIFKSAKSDFEGGYLFEVRNLVQADVFSDELDLAAHYLNNDGKTAAAVVAGVVLETALRKLVANKELAGSTLNRMNQSLHKADVYSQITWRQVQAWADIRNAAAHGNPDKFDDNDVTRMIDGIRDFVASHMS